MNPLSLSALRFAPFAAIILSIAHKSFTAEFPTFTVHRIDNFGKNIGQTALVDVDRDGDLDWIAGNASYAGGEICWWEFQAPDRWVRHPLGKGNTDVGGAAFDVNGDGWVDFVAGSILLLNSREPRTKPFLPFEIGTIHSHDTEFADVNSDGRIDLVANSDKSGLFWYEIPAIPTNKWTAHLIGSLEEHTATKGGTVAGGPHPDENVTVLCDVNQLALDSASQRYPQTRKFTDLRRVFDRPNDFDAVVISMAEHTRARRCISHTEWCEPHRSLQISGNQDRTNHDCLANSWPIFRFSVVASSCVEFFNRLETHEITGNLRPNATGCY